MATQPETVYPHITKDPAVCSGSACVAGTRVRVLDIVASHEQGMTPEEMVEEFPSLKSIADVYAAFLYYADHKDEVEADNAEGERILAEAERYRQKVLESRQS